VGDLLAGIVVARFPLLGDCYDTLAHFWVATSLLSSNALRSSATVFIGDAVGVDPRVPPLPRLLILDDLLAGMVAARFPLVVVVTPSSPFGLP
jgi:hypothetical protein